MIGGYTYFDETQGEIPPWIESIEPHILDTLGGESVRVYGEDFDPGVQVLVDDVDVSATWIDESTLEFVSLPHDAGLADVRAINPSGAEDLRSGGLVFVESVTWPPT